MKIKIKESNIYTGLVPYLQKVSESRKKLHEYFGSGNAITFSDADNYARMTYGITWGYNPIIELCVDHQREEINNGLTVDADTLVYSTDSLLANREPGQMGYERPPTTGRDSMDTNVYRDPAWGTGTGPTGSNLFRGNLTPVSQQTRVAVGTDSAHRKPEGVWQTAQTEVIGTVESKKPKVVRLKI